MIASRWLSGELAREVVGRLEKAVADFEAAGHYRDAGAKPAVFHRRGRGSEVDGAPLCAFIEAATEIAEAGVPVLTTACFACPLRDVCAYMTQDKEIMDSIADKTRATIVVGDHAHAFMPLPDGSAADAVIVDEQLRALGTVDSKVPLERLGNLPNLHPAPFDANKLKAELEAAEGDSAAPWCAESRAEIEARHEAEHAERERERNKEHRKLQVVMRAVANALEDQAPHSKPLLALKPHRDAMAAAAKAFRQRSDRALGDKLSTPEKKLFQKHLGEHDPEAEAARSY